MLYLFNIWRLPEGIGLPLAGASGWRASSPMEWFGVDSAGHWPASSDYCPRGSLCLLSKGAFHY